MLVNVKLSMKKCITSVERIQQVSNDATNQKSSLTSIYPVCLKNYGTLQNKASLAVLLITKMLFIEKVMYMYVFWGGFPIPMA